MGKNVKYSQLKTYLRGSDDKESACNAGYLGLISGWRHVHTLKNQVFNDYLGFPSASGVKNSPTNAGDPGSIPGSGRSPREGNDNPLQYPCLGNSMDRGAWQVESMGTQRFAQNLPTRQQKLCVFSDIGRGSQCKCRTETEQNMANEDLSRPHKGTHLYMRAFTSAHRNT